MSLIDRIESRLRRSDSPLRDEAIDLLNRLAQPTEAEAERMSENIPLPVAVYGTLRPGWGNSRLWEGKAHAMYDGTAYVLNYRLVGHGFPYAIRDEGSESIVTLIFPHAEHYDTVLRQMDDLEGVDFGHYRREMVSVCTPDGYMVTWMYVPCNDQRTTTREVRRNADGRYDWNLGTLS